MESWFVYASIAAVLIAGRDAELRLINGSTGELIWEFNTAVDFSAFTSLPSHGGSIESDGPVVLDNNIFINSGYQYGGRLGGNVLLNFEISK